MTQVFVTGDGRPVRIRNEIGRGGEGAVFETDDPSSVAKLYNEAPSQQKMQKLTAMSAGCTPRLLGVAAWPQATLHERRGGPVHGFLMRRIAGHHDIHILYGPKTRTREFPDAGYRFLVHAAANLARAFATVHAHGHVIGDVNEGGACVALDGTVTLVDCDSFQVSVAGSTYPCDVGSPIYQPPEFQNLTSFRNLIRTTEHDAFGLSILIFRTLFLARHPFAGAYAGSGDMPIEEAIRTHRFAYGRNASACHMSPPPGSLGLGILPANIASSFERAFGDPSGGRRPSALEWVNSLDDLSRKLQDCSVNRSHAYFKELSSCPLCQLEVRTSTTLFLPPIAGGTGPSRDSLQALWERARGVIERTRASVDSLKQLPPFAPTIPVEVARYANRPDNSGLYSSLALAAGVLVFFGTSSCGGSIAVALVGLVIGSMLQDRGPASASGCKAKLAESLRAIEAARGALDRSLRGHPAFVACVACEQAHGAFSAELERQRVQIAAFEAAINERRLNAYLDQFEVVDAQITGIGPSIAAVLQSYGIETAADVPNLERQHVPGIGPVRRRALQAWRQRVVASFRGSSGDRAEVRERDLLRQRLAGEEVAVATRLLNAIKALPDSPLHESEFRAERAALLAAAERAAHYQAILDTIQRGRRGR